MQTPASRGPFFLGFKCSPPHPGRVAWRIVERGAVGSTNDEARALAEAGDAGPLAVVAEAQTRGRGRRGRTWLSERGGLYLSALFTPPIPAPRLGLLPLAAGLAVAETVEGLGLAPELRWPNDLLVGGRKLAGVLCESRLRPDGALAWVIVGIGVNVRQPPAAVAAAGGVTLAELGRGGPPSLLGGLVLEALEAAADRAGAAPERLVAAWSRRATMLGKPVLLETTGGLVAGTAERVGPAGALVVRTADGVREITDPDLVRVER